MAEKAARGLTLTLALILTLKLSLTLHGNQPTGSSRPVCDAAAARPRDGRGIRPGLTQTRTPNLNPNPNRMAGGFSQTRFTVNPMFSNPKSLTLT